MIFKWQEKRCKKSITILKDKVEEYLYTKHDIKDPWFIDLHEEYTGPCNDETVIDIVMFGSFVRRFFECVKWSGKKYRLWVMCNASKNVMVNLLGIDEKNVSVIPRYELFEKSSKMKKMPQIGDKWQMVYSGRISQTKNAECVVYLANTLQKKFNIPVELIMCGPYDNHYDRSHGGRDFLNFRTKMSWLIDKLDWNLQPKIFEKLDEDEWINKRFKNPAMISLSTFMCEDFGVSLAQAQSKGWPCIVSDWGAHRDIEEENVIKVRPQDIGVSNDFDEIIQGKAYVLAYKIVKSMAKKGDEEYSEVAKTVDDVVPTVVDRSELMKIREIVVDKWGEDILKIMSNEIELVAESKRGGKFWQRYREIFGGHESDEKSEYIMIINDLNPYENQLVKNVPRLVRLWTTYAHLDDKNLEYVSLRNIFQKDSLMKLANAKKIILSFFRADMIDLINFIKNEINPESKITVFVNKERCTVVTEKLEKILDSRRDKIIYADQDDLDGLELGDNPEILCGEKIVDGPQNIKDGFHYIEIEISSKCNRACSYCPNSKYERPEQGEMDMALFDQLIQQLSEINYSGYISYHFYNEPLIASNLNEIIKKTKNGLPESKINLYSNGRLLDYPKFVELKDMGVDLITVTKHENEEDYKFDKVYEGLSKEEKKMVIYVKHQDIMFSNRSGLLKGLGKKRSKELQCYIPTYLTVVTLKGNVLTCYEDYMQKNIMGNIKDNHIWDIWNSKKYEEFRAELRNKKRDKYELCSECNNIKIVP